MAIRPMRRRLCGLALVGSLALLLPAAAEARPRLDPERRPAVQEPFGGFLARVGEVFARIWEQTGMIIDPNGEPRPSGTSEGDTGKLIDPNG